MVAYHDLEWGTPEHDETRLFELLTLEGAQAGLSWDTVLRKREGYRRAFAGFDVERVAGFGQADVERLLADAAIIRNRGKVESTIANARAILALHEHGETFDSLLWSFVDGVPRQNKWQTIGELPETTDESAAMAKRLKALGYRFVGPTTCYSLMQAAGLVNDHTVDCFRHAPLVGDGAAYS